MWYTPYSCSCSFVVSYICTFLLKRKLCSSMALQLHVVVPSFPMCVIGFHVYVIVDTAVLLEVNN
jgi:hypothetical protein